MYLPAEADSFLNLGSASVCSERLPQLVQLSSLYAYPRFRAGLPPIQAAIIPLRAGELETLRQQARFGSSRFGIGS